MKHDIVIIDEVTCIHPTLRKVISEALMDHYKIHWKLGNQTGGTVISAVTKQAAIQAFEVYARMDFGNAYNIPFEAVLVKAIKLSTTPATKKQQLARSYGFIMGSVKGGLVNLRHIRTTMILCAGPNTAKLERAFALAESQFAKLQRDIADAYKLAGLKIK